MIYGCCVRRSSFVLRPFMSMNLQTTIIKALRRVGDTTPVRDLAVVGGGCISQALRLETERGSYLLKTSEEQLPGFFEAEAKGLQLIASTNTVRVPEVLAYHDAVPADDQRRMTNDENDESDNPSFVRRPSSVVESSFILLEWLQPPPHADHRAAAAHLGYALAALHRTCAAAYGLEHDNYLGTSRQVNAWTPGWTAFFREHRLLFQAELAMRNGYWNNERARRMERVLDQLDKWIDDSQVQPSLIHGDLWSGNYLVGPDGGPALIDPAVYYGDREAELAYTAMFTPFPEAFYRAYEEAWPLPDGWRERRPLYNLYHLVNHLNHFGESYGSAVDSVLKQYAG